jgi:hypothetical protein
MPVLTLLWFLLFEGESTTDDEIGRGYCTRSIVLGTNVQDRTRKEEVCKARWDVNARAIRVADFESDG